MGSLAEVVENCFGVLQLYSDGSVYRANESEINFEDYIYNLCANEIVGEDCIVKWEEFMYDEKNKLYLRVYKPSFKQNNNQKLRVVYYLHGGGFCLGSRTWPNYHNCCLRLSSQLQALVIAPDYRLAPEHRLPAAIEDGLNAVKWLQIQGNCKHLEEVSTGKDYNGKNPCNNNLLLNGVDFEKVFIIGDSSGGNIAHHMAIRLGCGSPELSPVRVCGYILLGPFFGGSLRTKSEAYGPPEPILTLDSLDRFWRLSLPMGEDRDHPLANPFGPYSPNLEKVSLDPMLILVGGKEIMKDRVEDYACKLKSLGKDITYAEFEGEHHGFFTHNPCSHVSNQLAQLIKHFIFTTTPS